MKSIPTICLIGPTASGKSTLAMKLAETLPIEIVNIDSTLIYQGMNIGTAKPTKNDQKKVRHHLIDIIQPNEKYSAARFAIDAKKICEDIVQRQHIPLLVGGTMLYYTAFVKPLSNLPEGNQTLREHINQQAKRFGWPALHNQLKLIDPDTAAKISPQDSQRIQRAIEVFKLTGRRLSSLIQQSNRENQTKETKCNNNLTVSLIPRDRALIHKKIANRFDIMLSNGFLEEVIFLRKNFDLTEDMPSMRSIGYRQAWLYLDKKLSISEFREQTLAATRQLCKRQLTWLRRIEAHCAIDPLSETILEQLLDLLKKYVNLHD